MPPTFAMFERFIRTVIQSLAHHFQPWPFLGNWDNSFPDNPERRIDPDHCRATTFPKFQRKKQGKYFGAVLESNSQSSTIQPSAFNMQVVAMIREPKHPELRVFPVMPLRAFLCRNPN